MIATLILPADTAWNGAAGGPAAVPAPPPRERVGHERIAEVARLLRSGEPNGVLLAGGALRGPALALAGRISATTGARLMAQTSNARMERGAGRVAVPRVPYNVDPALAFLSGLKHLVLVGAKAPVAFFAYPDKPGVLTPPDCAIEVLARPEHDLLLALEDLTEELGASEGAVAVQERRVPALAEGSITLERLASSVAALLPDDAIVVDEAVSAGHVLYAGLTAAAPHDWLQLTGGSIGEGLPLALGAAIACQQRKVVCLQADGSAMYTVQALWTMARERLDVTTVILNNRAYEILKGELANVGARNAGRKALDMMSLDRPEIDWAGLARSMGVEGHRADTMEAFNRLFAGAVAGKGPVLIDARL